MPPPGISPEDLSALLTEAARRPWLTGAIAAGWQVSDASRDPARAPDADLARTQPGRRSGRVHPLHQRGRRRCWTATRPRPRWPARLERYAQLTTVPYSRSAAYTGHDLVKELDARRKKVLTGPADPPPGAAVLKRPGRLPARPGRQRGAAAVHCTPTTPPRHGWPPRKAPSWASAPPSTGTAPEFDARLPGLWRVEPPAWDTRTVPDPLGVRRKLRDGTIWVYTPLLAMAADVFDARIRPLEAWVWPEHTRYLDLWASQLDTARRALEGAAAVLPAAATPTTRR